MIIDRKFKFTAVNPCNGKHYSEKDAIVFCAKDKALIPTLQAYYGECVYLECGQEHLESVELLMDRVKTYQAAHEAKVPDTETDCEIDRCIGGNV